MLWQESPRKRVTFGGGSRRCKRTDDGERDSHDPEWTECIVSSDKVEVLSDKEAVLLTWVVMVASEDG